MTVQSKYIRHNLTTYRYIPLPIENVSIFHSADSNTILNETNWRWATLHKGMNISNLFAIEKEADLMLNKKLWVVHTWQVYRTYVMSAILILPNVRQPINWQQYRECVKGIVGRGRDFSNSYSKESNL